jgi:signal transduction histidine kinase/DNA-binding response OmpR family regulator
MGRGLFPFLSNSKKYVNHRFVLKRSLILFFLLFGAASLLAQNTTIDSLKQLLNIQQGVSKINTLNALASASQLVGVNSAINYANDAYTLALNIKDNKSIITSGYALGTLYGITKNDSLSYKYLRNALDLAFSIEDAYLITVGYLRLSSYYRYIYEPWQSVELLNKSLIISEENNFIKQIGETHIGLGDSYRSLGRYEKSLNNYLMALRINESLNDQTAIAENLNSIGNVYQRTDDYENAMDYFIRALEINQLKKNVKNITMNIHNIGVIHQKNGDYQKALINYQNALTIAESSNDTLGQGIITENIGSVLVKQGKLELGLEHLNKALTLMENRRTHRSILSTLNEISLVKIQMGEGQGAKEVAEKVIYLAKEYEESDQLRDGYLNLSNSYTILKDYEKAHLFLEKYNALNDSLFGIEKTQQINELQIQYETEKKDQEISSLQHEKEIAGAQRKIYFLIAAIVLLVMVGLYFNQRLRTKRNRLLLEKEKEVDRLKSNFFANISHEFRTPLTLILGPIESMLAEIKDKNHQYQLGLMQRSASRLLRLINQILDLSKLESGQLELKVKEINMANLIKGVTGSFQSMADSKDIDLECEVSDTEIQLYGDQSQIETIFINLISNAFKFSDTGGRITVRLNKNDTGEVVLQVMDNGVGIPSEQVEQIFNRFYQAGSASTNQYEGTGIGLALTKELVELHSGTIQVTSELGKGTEVTVRFPFGNDHLQKANIDTEKSKNIEENSYREVFTKQAQAQEVDIIEEKDAEKPIVLLIEDNEDVRKYIKSILGEKYTLLEASDGLEGLDQAKAFIPDLIISDVMMPKMNGYEACRNLKQDEKTSHIPIILLTAKASLNSRLEGLETEADLYLNKPFAPKELLLCIHNLIQSRKKLRDRYNRQVVLKPTDIAINSIDELFLQRLLKLLEEFHHDEHFSVEQLSKEIGMSRSQLHRKLQALTNQTPSQFINSFRLQRAMELLKKNHASVSEIAYLVGFASHSYFNKCFLLQYGSTPSSVIESSMDSGDKK